MPGFPSKRQIIDSIKRNSLILAPFLLFVADLIIRAALGVDVVDAGVDMAGIAVAACVTLIAIDLERGNKNRDAVAILVFAVVFIVMWLGCLWFLSPRHPLGFLPVSDALVNTIREMAIFVIGFVALLLAVAFIPELAHEK